MAKPRLAVLAAVVQDEPAAQILSQQLQLGLLQSGTDYSRSDELDAVLYVSGDTLSLRQTGKRAPGPVSVVFGSSAMRHRRSAGHNELLGKAVGVGKKTELRVIDATAGLGQDSFVLADLGCRVTLCEREPLIAALLRSGMDAAIAAGDAWLRDVLGRMRLHNGDARELVGDAGQDTEVIYLDPMFPPREKSAAVKKEMALFQLLLDSEQAQRDADQLLLWALRQDVARVVVKRPPRAAQLAGQQPSHSISGKAIRYDVYVRRKLA